MRNPQSHHRDFDDFPIGTRVTVICHGQDFHFFHGDEAGVVIENGGKYLSIVVSFDEPLKFRDGYQMYQFNFNPADLIIRGGTSEIRDENDWPDLKFGKPSPFLTQRKLASDRIATLHTL